MVGWIKQIEEGGETEREGKIQYTNTKLNTKMIFKQCCFILLIYESYFIMSVKNINSNDYRN